jgi:hypothetical protein
MTEGLLLNGTGSCPGCPALLQPHSGAGIAGVNIQLDVRPARSQALHERHQAGPAQEGTNGGVAGEP